MQKTLQVGATHSQIRQLLAETKPHRGYTWDNSERFIKAFDYVCSLGWKFVVLSGPDMDGGVLPKRADGRWRKGQASGKNKHVYIREGSHVDTVKHEIGHVLTNRYYNVQPLVAVLYKTLKMEGEYLTEFEWNRLDYAAHHGPQEWFAAVYQYEGTTELANIYHRYDDQIWQYVVRHWETILNLQHA